jgi:hypothetical protein
MQPPLQHLVMSAVRDKVLVENPLPRINVFQISTAEFERAPSNGWMHSAGSGELMAAPADEASRATPCFALVARLSLIFSLLGFLLRLFFLREIPLLRFFSRRCFKEV